MADAEHIKRVANRIVQTKRAGNEVVAVVSAGGDTTDELTKMAYEVSDSPSEREMDMLLSAGERISIALLSIAIEALGQPSVSFTGSQAGIITDGAHTKAKIVEIKADRVHKELSKGRIVIVAGFQGVSRDEYDVTTLGRGGSDTTAVALAAGLGAAKCEIYTDVDGVYSADPRIVSDAVKLTQVSYEEMLEMAATGAKILQTRSVEFARRYGIELHVRSSFNDSPGTVVREEDGMEEAIIRGVTHDISEAKLTIRGVPDRPGIAAIIFGTLADKPVNVDMIIQNISEDGHTDISFTVPKEDLDTAQETVDSLVKDLDARGSACDPGVAKVTLIGAGMKSHPGVAASMFRCLSDAGINIEMISTSSIKISCVVDESNATEAVRLLHKEFDVANSKSEAG